MDLTQTITLTIKGDTYTRSISMTQDSGLQPNDELFEFLVAGLMHAGFSYDTVKEFLSNDQPNAAAGFAG